MRNYVATLEAEKQEILATLAAAESREIQWGQRANVAEAERDRMKETTFALAREIDRLRLFGTALEAENKQLREALELALPWLVKASETGLSSCAEAGRRALVNPDQHSDGCLVEIAIRKAKRALNKADAK